MKKVRIIEPTVDVSEAVKKKYRQIRVAAYCRVSTKQEEQLNSYSVQKDYYTQKITSEPRWTLAGIYADKGITGTSTKNRDEFNKMIRACKRGKIDMIITKSISRFARNTLDCIKYTRLLKDLNIDVFFEEQGIHSIDNGAEFYITLYGSLAQSESENISANVKWGKERSAKNGKANFHYKNTLGYRKGADGNPEIVPEEAETIRFIYQRFLAGDSLGVIKRELEHRSILSPGGKDEWSQTTIQSILTNEKYKGDVVINKHYVVDCISKKVKKNNGERTKYYIENNHPPIIDEATFGRAQEELARRNSMKKVKQVGTKTELGKYSSKYALTKLLVCGECGSPYRRCTWTSGGHKRYVWRCINRLDYGKKYCYNSPTIVESVIQSAIMKTVQKLAMQNTKLFDELKSQIAINLNCEKGEDRCLEINVRLAEINAEFRKLLNGLSVNLESNEITEQTIAELMIEKHSLENELSDLTRINGKMSFESKLDEVSHISQIIKDHPLRYDDNLIRQILECVVVQSKDQIKVIFKDGTEIEQQLSQ